MTSDLLEENQDLRKENAELKEAIKHFNPCGEWNDDVHDCEFRHYSMEYGSKLAKAKDLLKHWVNSYGYIDVALCSQTDQFIKENE